MKIKDKVVESVIALLAVYMADNGQNDKAVDLSFGERSYVLIVKKSGDVFLTETDGDVLLVIKSGRASSPTKAIKVIADYVKMEMDD